MFGLLSSFVALCLGGKPALTHGHDVRLGGSLALPILSLSVFIGVNLWLPRPCLVRGIRVIRGESSGIPLHRPPHSHTMGLCHVAGTAGPLGDDAIHVDYEPASRRAVHARTERGKSLVWCCPSRAGILASRPSCRIHCLLPHAVSQTHNCKEKVRPRNPHRWGVGVGASEDSVVWQTRVAECLFSISVDQRVSFPRASDARVEEGQNTERIVGDYIVND